MDRSALLYGYLKEDNMAKILCILAGYDIGTDYELQGIQDSLYDMGFEGVQTKDIPMHFTLGTYDPEQEEELKERLVKISESTEEFDVEFNHVGLFRLPSNDVLFLAPEVSREMLSLKDNFLDSKDQFSWSPHTTMLIDHKDIISDALKVVMDNFHPIKGKVNVLHLYEFFPARHIMSRQLGKPELKIIDATSDMLSSFDAGQFDMNSWKGYIDFSVPGAKDICIKDMEQSFQASVVWEDDILPVVERVWKDTAACKRAIRSFHQVTEGLNDKINDRFGRTVDADVYLYLGLCNGAGWVTDINGKTTVLLGIEKILELDWCDEDSMNGLIIHELGHVYHSQYGDLYSEPKSQVQRFVHQLFTEGVAMVFEQEVLGDPEYFHQDRAGWKKWCDDNHDRLKKFFAEDLPTMTIDDQRYFGDWVNFDGHIDTGYYLGVSFVRYLMQDTSFDEIISYSMDRIYDEYSRWMQE